MGNTSQDQEEGELAQPGVAERGSDSEIGGDLVECVEKTEDGTAGGFGSGVAIEFAPQETPEGGDAGSGPGGNVEEGAIFDFAILAEGLAKEDGRRGVSVGDLRYVHEFNMNETITKVKYHKNNYMTTKKRAKRGKSLRRNHFRSKWAGRSV
jgi:hypothetical protein